MITNADARNISGNLKLEHEKYTVTDGNLIKLVQQAICAYKHPQMSVIREYAVNGRDAMKLHNIDKPIEVVTPTTLSPKLTIRDYGGGMTEEETRSLLFSFGASGQEKQVSNRYVGGFGIGSKSAFNLSDSFLFSVFYKGTMTTWQCMLDEENFPTAAKMTSTPTDEDDGVLVVIPSKPFDEDEALNALKWLDVPVKLNGRLVESYKTKSQMGGVTSFKTKEGNDLEVKWDIVPKQSSGGDLTFIVGCGAIYVSTYRLPHDAMQGVSIPNYFSGKFVIELPIGSVTLMTSREDFVYNERTNYVIRKALRAAIDDAHDQIMQQIYEAPGTRAMIDKLAELRKIYDGWGFSTLVGSCVKKVRETTNLEELRSEICRELEISDKNGIDMALVSYVVRGGRSYSYDYKYRTSNLANGGFDGTFPSGGPHIWRATPDDMWRDSFVNEFSEMAQFGLSDTSRILVGTPTMFDKENNDNRRIVFEGLSWKNMNIEVYPSGTKKFIGLAREYISSFGKNVSKTAPLILTLCGDIKTIKDNVVSMFPGARVVYHTEVETFKTYKPGVRRKTKSGKPIARRKLWGWIAQFVPKKIDLNDPEDIVFTMLREDTKFEISTKTSFMEYEGSEKPLFYMNLEDAKDRTDECRIVRRARHAVMNMLLGNADVLKDENGIPLIAIINQYAGAPKIGVPFVDGDDIKGNPAPADNDEKDRYAMWLYRLLSGDRSKNVYKGGDVFDASWYVAQTGLKTYDSTIMEIKCCSSLLEYLVEELKGRRLCPDLRKAIDDIKLLFTRPKTLPYTQKPSFSVDFTDGSSRFIKAYNALFSGMPVAESFLDRLSPYDKSKPSWLKASAENLATLIAEKSRNMSAKKEEKDDNKQ
jgi:hypothetical protein